MTATSKLCIWCLCPLPSVDMETGVSTAVMDDYVGPEELCEAETSSLFGPRPCTRELGHEPPHVQCGMQFHDIARWD